MTADTLFKVLGNKIRLRLLCLLRESDLRVGDLQTITGLPMAMVSKDLMRMRNQKLVVAKRRGISITYSLPKTSETKALLAILDAARALLPPEIPADAAALSAHTPSEIPETAAEEKQFWGNTSRENSQRGKTSARKPPATMPQETEDSHFGSLPTNLL